MTDEFDDGFERVETTAVEAITKGEVLSQVDIAKRYPRDLAKFERRATAVATHTADVAMGCFYALERRDRNGKKSTIEGPSIRLAEIAAANYGNLRVGARVVDEGDRFLVAQGIAHDLETNVAYSVEVRRRITTKSGHKYSDDMIGVTANAACAIALRNAILKAIPAALVRPIYEKAKSTAVGTAQTLAVRQTRMVDAFAKMRVPLEALLWKVEKDRIEDVDLEDIKTLIGVFNGIRDGQTTIDEQFGEFVSEEPESDSSAPSDAGDRFQKEEAPKGDDAAEEPVEGEQGTFMGKAPADDPKDQEPDA